MQGGGQSERESREHGNTEGESQDGGIDADTVESGNVGWGECNECLDPPKGEYDTGDTRYRCQDDALDEYLP